MSSPFDPYDQSRADLPPPRGLRPPYRPPVGIPSPTPERPWRSAAASVAVHALILFLVLAPIFAADSVREAIAAGAGGPGPAGGGGGGRGGTGGEQERVRYIQVAPAPPAPPAPKPVETPPVVPPLVPPVPPREPEPEVKPDSVPAAPSVDVSADLKTAVDVSLAAGRGGGTGNDGTAGSGPGTGGGVGSGVGTGRGSGVGPGTGGGEGAVYPPTPIQMLLPPFDMPQKVRGKQIPVTFDVDSTGRLLSVQFPSTGDGGYDRRLRKQLTDYRFRPAVRSHDGAPVRASFVAVITL